MKNVINTNTVIYKDITNIFGLLNILNEFKRNPGTLNDAFFNKSHFLDIVSRDSIYDCYVVELALLRSNLRIDFNGEVTISHLSGLTSLYKDNILSRFSIAATKLSGMFYARLLRSNKDKIFDSSTDVKVLIQQGTTIGDNCISINGEIHKSFLLNQIVLHGRRFF